MTGPSQKSIKSSMQREGVKSASQADESSPPTSQPPGFSTNRAASARSALRNFTERLIAHETGQKKSLTAAGTASFSVIAKLRPTLVNLMGSIGFAALLARALALASAELTWLKNVQISADGLFEGLDLLAEQQGRDEFSQGQLVLLAQLLQLLVTFIGQKLTLQLVLEIWPTLRAHDLNFSEKGGE